MQDAAREPLVQADLTSLCLTNLVLTGTATPFLHNGIIPPGPDDTSNVMYTGKPSEPL